MKNIKLYVTVLTMLCILFANQLFAQGVPDNGGDPIDVPVDAAIGLLATGAALLGFKKK
jgi:hypothetical protein